MAKNYDYLRHTPTINGHRDPGSSLPSTQGSGGFAFTRESAPSIITKDGFIYHIFKDEYQAVLFEDMYLEDGWKPCCCGAFYNAYEKKIKGD